MSKKSSSGGFSGWGKVGLVALLVVGGFLARNQFNSGNTTTVNGNSNNTNVQGGIHNNNNNTTVYGSADSLLVIPSSSPTITSSPKPASSTKPTSEYALQVVEPPILLKPIQQGNFINVVGVAPGQEYKLDFVVNYKSRTLTKFYANILPDAKDAEQHNKAHLDNISVTGKALQGDGTMRFSLRGKAPLKRGEYERAVTLGLMDYQNWMKQPPFVTYGYPFVLSVR
ncbi:MULTISPECIES: hypothetical protein [unclassified Microcoleus]|uniref:hypothetical protein n=1 Tax=unclassified Microcoleus TaxID=2642155 RepID=UPI0025E501BE|nr:MULTISPECIES: hypothetical protein [unclassified Microcoleus]